MLSGPQPTIKHARALRKDLSLPEVLLWGALRKRPGGFKFRRQHPAGRYVADFFCHEAGLIVEIDGEAHNLADRAERDVLRDHWFRSIGLTVMRIAARDVLADIGGVVEGIVQRCRASRALHQPLAGPPPQALLGEELMELRP